VNDAAARAIVASVSSGPATLSTGTAALGTSPSSVPTHVAFITGTSPPSSLHLMTISTDKRLIRRTIDLDVNRFLLLTPVTELS
jgi:hypothetical protein